MTRLTTRPALAVAGVLAASLTAAPAFASTAKTPTSLTLKAAHSTVAPKAKDTLTGLLKAGSKPLANQQVTLEKRAAGTKRWTFVTNKSTDKSGKVVLTVVPGTKKGQKEQYELVFAGTNPKTPTPATPAYAPSHSQIITITVS